LIGALLGLALGVALAVWLERRDRRIRDPRQIEEALGSPIVGRIPRSRALRKTGPGVWPLPPAEEEAFSILRANLDHLLQTRKARSMLVTSAAPGDGKTTVAWNFARTEAIAGARVLLIEADMRHPVLAVCLGVNGAPGLSEVLAQQAELHSVIRSTSLADAGGDGAAPGTVDVLFAGQRPPNPAELMGSERMQGLLKEASEGYDLVVVDTPPTLVVADSMPMLDLVGGVLVVSRVGLSTWDAMVALRRQLQNHQANPLGVVVNSDARSPHGRYYY
jgi:capsular exopolysaccharide synthesis family protein